MNLWHYICGYVMINISGNGLERFANICIKRGIILRDLQVLPDKKIMTAMINARSMDALFAVGEKCSCCIEVYENKGRPRVLPKLKRRLFLLLGIALFVACIFMSNLYIWNIEIVCDDVIDEAKVFAVLEKAGVYPGAKRSGIDMREAEFAVLQAGLRVSWVEIYERGMKIVVSLTRSTENPIINEDDEPCNIVADKDGIVRKINALAGRKMVKAGDVFAKGDVLVSGIVPLVNMIKDEDEYSKRMAENAESMKVHARATILAETSYEYFYPLDLSSDNQKNEESLKEALDNAYRMACNALDSEAPADCVVNEADVRVIDASIGQQGCIKVTFDCVESVGVETAIPNTENEQEKTSKKKAKDEIDD